MAKAKRELVDLVRRQALKPGTEVFELTYRRLPEPGEKGPRTCVGMVSVETFLDLLGVPRKEQAAKLQQLLDAVQR